MSGDGFLAIWSDVAADDETDYLLWLTREHIAERLRLPGFLAVRVFRARISQPRYLIIYALHDQSAVVSSAYLARLNDPTPWTQRIMRKLSNFKRGGGTVRCRAGSGQGGIVAALVDRDVGSQSELQAVAEADGICAVSILETDRASTDIRTNEKDIRAGDQSFERVMLVEGLSDRAVISCLETHRLRAAGDPAALYQLVFSR